MSADRSSKAEAPEIIADPQKRADREALNALRQFDTAIQTIDDWLLRPERRFRLRPSLTLQLHRVALEGISSFAGNYRPAGVEIEGSKHEPVGAHMVPEALEDMCDYVNDHWSDRSALHLAAYVMWRLNWIHPFDDGNGRTSRMVSYVVLCVRLEYRLPGRYTIPEQIAEDKAPYYKALEEADAAFKAGRTDVGALEELLAGMLAKQLLSVYEIAKKNNPGAASTDMKLH